MRTECCWIPIKNMFDAMPTESTASSTFQSPDSLSMRPRSFTLFFEPGESLTIYDDNEKYESSSINFEGTLGIYV